jgi:hypothetical protein
MLHIIFLLICSILPLFLLYDVLHTVISTKDLYRATALLIPQLDCYERQPFTYVLDILNLSKQLW